MRRILFFVALLLPVWAFAFAPRLVSTEAVAVTHPEVAQIFYDTLVGEARAYRFTSDTEWNLKLSLLVPASVNPKGKFDAVVVNESSGSVASDSMEGVL
jgi:hypothetical protein